MKNKLLVFVFGIFLISLVGAAEVSYCCEKTIGGVWCMNEPEAKCDSSYRTAPTSCESTSYCKLGTCINPEEGDCMENTPQKTCEDAGGFWKDDEPEDISQCKLGCCLIGDQAAFVTQTRCKRLTALYGLETIFRTDVSSEIQCIASASPRAKGACVFEKEFEETCTFTTKKQCQEMEISTPTNILEQFDSESDPVTSVRFYEGKLCSDEKLATNCGKSKETTCVEGRDEVFFLDSCGNLANIYDAKRQNDPNYWAEIEDSSKICNLDSAGARSCGNCDYFQGSTCKKTERGSNPTYGDYICEDLSCEYNGEPYEHGETWCADAAGADKNLPGSRHFRLVCYNGDITVEPCADFRQEVCVESDLDDFSTSACRVNMWEDCFAQDEKKDCENIDKRDCQWVNSGNLKEGLSDGDIEKLNEMIIDNEDISEEWFNTWEYDGEVTGIADRLIASSYNSKDYFVFSCIPKYAPGFDFWQEGDAEEICSLANAQGTVTYRSDWAGDKPDKDMSDCENEIGNCWLITDGWQQTKKNLCISLGDCGSSKNYIGQEGYDKWEDLLKRQ